MSETNTLKILKLDPNVLLPEYKTAGSAGMDLAYFGKEVLVLPIQEVVFVPTGLSLAIPLGMEGQIRPRSGFSTKHKIIMPNSPGTIDSDYRGEILIPLLNLGRSAFSLEPGTRIAQIVFQRVEILRIEEVSKLDSTHRGEGGFGSTGK